MIEPARKRAPIGVFDSGIGGLTVAKAIYDRLPCESTIYFGDTARVPYGPKSPETVRRYSLEILHWLLGQGVKAVVIACNTSTAHALETLRDASPVPVVGVIEPGARAAVRASRGGPVGVIGTVGTIGSDAYARAIHAIAPAARVAQRACPLFVPLVEEGWLDHEVTRMVANEYLAELKTADLDSLILGCTHYPMLAPLLKTTMGGNVRLIDSGAEAAHATAELLSSTGLLVPPGAREPQHHFFLSDEPRRRSFTRVAEAFLGRALPPVSVVDQTDLPWYERGYDAERGSVRHAATSPE